MEEIKLKNLTGQEVKIIEYLKNIYSETTATKTVMQCILEAPFLHSQIKSLNEIIQHQKDRERSTMSIMRDLIENKKEIVEAEKEEIKLLQDLLKITENNT